MSLSTGHRVTINQIIEAVAVHYGLTATEIKSSKRSRLYQPARKMAMHLCRVHTEKSTGDIGNELGGRDHSTVCYGDAEAIKFLQCRPQYRRDKELIERALFPNTPEAICSTAAVARDHLNYLCNSLDAIFAGRGSDDATLFPKLTAVLEAAREVSRARGVLLRTVYRSEGLEDARKNLNKVLVALDAAIFEYDGPDFGRAGNTTTAPKTQIQGETVCQK